MLTLKSFGGMALMAFEVNTSCGGTALATCEDSPYPCGGTAFAAFEVITPTANIDNMLPPI